MKENLINLEDCLRKRLDVKERVFGRWIGADRSREIEEMRIGSRRAYIYILSNSRQIEVSRKTTSTNATIEKVSRNKAKTQEQKLDRSTSYRGSRNFLDWSTSYRGSVEIVIRKSSRARQIARCRGGIEELSRLLKNRLSRREKYRYECNQACNSTKDPNIILNF